MKFKFRYLAAIIVILLIAGVVYRVFFSFPSFPQGPQGPVLVGIVTIKAEKVRIWREFSGMLEATDMAEIRPQVTGRIDTINFEEGSYVNKGDVLFTIDPRLYYAEFKSAEAALNSARSNFKTFQSDLKRSDSLIKEKAISSREFEGKRNGFESASAMLKEAESKYKISELNIEYSKVLAPISGRINRAEVKVGNLVAPNVDIVLATIVADEKLYAEFSVDEQSYVEFLNENKLEDDTKIPVKIQLTGEEKPSREAVLKSFDNEISPTNGTVRARAELDNKDGKLLSGLFVKVFLGNAKKANQILITEKAIGTDLDKKFVYVVNKENKVEYREIKLGGYSDGLRIVKSGLADGERIVVNGNQSVRPGVEVKAEEPTIQK